VSLAGRPVRCPRCGARFTIPAVGPGSGSASSGAHEPAPTVLETDAPAATALAVETDALAPTRAKEIGGAEARPAARLAWQPGDLVLGLYEVTGVLGQGGMGRVYRVRHRGWGLDLAVKVPLPSALEGAGGADVFEREAETWVNLGLHPHVVTCHYVRRVDGLPLVFAEYADGGSLHEAIRARSLRSVEAILDVAVQVAWGLHYAHEQGLVHRDVKPANVMLTADGLVKVTDFGLARARATRMAAIVPAAHGGAGHTLTVEGGGGGTPAYLSPEQAAGEALTRRSDLWSFALSLLEMFAGGRAWEYGLAAPEVLEAHRGASPTAPSLHPMPEAVAEFLARCFRERPDERPRTLADAASALRGVWETVAGRPYPRPEPRGGRGSPDGLNNRAVSLVDLGRVAEADTLWRRALEAEAHHVEATYNASLAAWTAGRVDDGELVRRMEEACASHASAARAQQLLGRLQLALGRAPDALAAFERAAGLGPADDLSRDIEAARVPVAPGMSLTLRGLPGTVSALVVTPDGRTVIAASGDEMRVWDAGTGTLLRSARIADGAVHALAVLPGGRYLVVGAEGAPLAVWDLVSGRAARAWSRQTGFATSLAVAPGGRLVVSGGSDRVVRLWDAATGRCLREMEGHEDAVASVAAGASRLASAGRDGTVRLWALDDGRPLGTLRGHEGRVCAVALDEARSRVVSAGDDRTVRDWGLNSRALVRAYKCHTQAVHAVALSPSGHRLFTGSADRSVRGWDMEAERLASLVHLEGAVHALVLAEDGHLWAAHGTAVSRVEMTQLHLPVAALCRPVSAAEVEARAVSFEERIEEARRRLTSGDFRTALDLARTARSVPGHERSGAALAVWDDLVARLPRRALRSAWEDARLEGHNDQVLAAAVDAKGAHAITGGLDSTVRVWDLAAHRSSSVLSGHDGAVMGVAFVGQGSRAISCGRDRTVRVWDLAAGRLLRTLEGHGEPVAAVDVSPDGALSATASWDGTVRLWDLRAGTTTRVLEGHGANVVSVCISRDGRAVASGGWDGAVRIWDAATGDPLSILQGHDGNVTAAALHPMGRQAASGGEDQTVRLWDLRTGRALRVLEGHAGEITGLAFTIDGRFLLSSSRDATVRVWDVRRGSAVRTLPHPAAVLALSLAPAGSVLASAGADRVGRLWHLDWEPEGAEPLVAATHYAAPWGELRGAASRGLRTLPSGRGALRRVPWARLAVGALALAAVAIGLASWHRPRTKVGLSAYMMKTTRSGVDLVDLRPFQRACDPGAFDAHLAAFVSGNPEAGDVACLAATGSASLVDVALDQAPLTDADPLQARRLRRNAASLFVGLGSAAVAPLCARLGDARADVRALVALALGVTEAPAAAACIRDALTEGGLDARAAAAAALPYLLSRDRIVADEGWTLGGRLLRDPDPAVRMAGLRLLHLFSASFAEPAARSLLSDPDPSVAAAAREALASIQSIRKTDLLLNPGAS
jgi:WD40 repeat protein/serine/threonine protein kinase